MGDQITIHVGPAAATIDALEGDFDFVFMDAEKDGYIGYYEAVLPRLSEHGLIVADNTLHGGRVFEAGDAIAAFNEHVAADPRTSQVLLTVRDGMTADPPRAGLVKPVRCRGPRIEHMVTAVVFDMDGVIVDTEQVWDEVREQLVADWGGRYSPAAQRAMMGMSSREWSRYMHDELGLAQSPEEINDEVVRRMLDALPHRAAADRRCGRRRPRARDVDTRSRSHRRRTGR